MDETEEGKQKATALQTPWFLKPYLTFPIAFAVVGVAFAFVVLNGGVYQRGIETEFLDDSNERIDVTAPTPKEPAAATLPRVAEIDVGEFLVE